MVLLSDNFFRDTLGIEDADSVNTLQRMSRIIYFKKNQIIFNIGEKPNILAFLNNGITRGYFVNRD